MKQTVDPRQRHRHRPKVANQMGGESDDPASSTSIGTSSVVGGPFFEESVSGGRDRWSTACVGADLLCMPASSTGSGFISLAGSH